MKAKNLLKFAVFGLKRRKARTSLTVLGVVIGTVCIVLMFAIGLSNYRQFEQNMLSDQSLLEITINNYYDSTMKNGITDSIIQSISTLPHIKTISPVIEFPVTIVAGNYQANLQLKGIAPEALNVVFDKGCGFKDSNAIFPIVCGGNTVQQFIDPQNPPNYADFNAMENYSPDIDLMNTEMVMSLGMGIEDSEMPLSQQYRVTISGITEKSYSESSYSTYIDIDSAKQILMENRELAEEMGLSISSYNTVKIIVNEMDNVETVLQEVKKLGYETHSPTESIIQIQEEQARQQGQLFAIGFISLLVSAIGIANTMYANILERRRDIGIMKVLGMRIYLIRNLFMTEAALIGLLGGLIGIGISYIITIVINVSNSEISFLGMHFSEGIVVSIPVWLSVAAIFITMVVGILSGIYPAYKATKMSVLEATRK
ncbi:MAG: ABC transporter permease [Eubacteriales bacterium]|nr:ABC transporter permease [Eubacteriales bacterium]